MTIGTGFARYWGMALVATVLAGGTIPAVAADVGMASFYGRSHAGKRMASGKRFNQAALTAAHRTLPFGTRVTVTNLRNGRSVVVEIADRGPFRRGRIIDVSYRAAQALDFVRAGVTKVSVSPL